MRPRLEGARAHGTRVHGGARAARVAPCSSPALCAWLAPCASLAACVWLAACVSSHQLIGAVRKPIPADEVRLSTEAPSRPYERIAVVSASSKRSFSFTFEGKAEVVVRRLKEEAGRLGANGVLLEGISDESGAAIGADVGSAYEGPRGTIDVGVGVSTLTLQRHGRAIAIYLPEP
jgi:hypothetical protein